MQYRLYYLDETQTDTTGQQRVSGSGQVKCEIKNRNLVTSVDICSFIPYIVNEMKNTTRHINSELPERHIAQIVRRNMITRVVTSGKVYNRQKFKKFE